MLRTTKQSGMAMVLALVLVAIFASLAIAFAAGTDFNARQSSSLADVCGARLQAESGVSYFVSLFSQNTFPPTADSGQALSDAVASCLSDNLDGSGNLAGQSVSYDGNTISVPEILVNGTDQGFSAHLSLEGNENVRLVVTGRDGTVSRTVRIDLGLIPDASAVFGYGVASRGRIAMWGGAEILGVNDPVEGSVLSALPSGEAISMRGRCTVDGDLSASGSSSYVSFRGNNNSVGGTSDMNEILTEHVHLGVPDPDFPEVDTSAFEPFATTVIDASWGNLNGGTYNNVRIAAETDPQFGNNVTINGVIYIESPNVVVFKSDCVINGVVITETGTGNSSCTIEFRSTVTANSVETLPDTPEFADLKLLTGTFLIAPGFEVHFKGQANSFNGAMAADKVDMWGHTSLTAKGFVIGLSDKDLTLHGNATINIDQDGVDDTPAGFNLPMVLFPLMDTYVETTGQ